MQLHHGIHLRPVRWAGHLLSAVSPLLDEHTVIDYLAGRGVETGAGATARELGGGVSNVVLAVEWGEVRVIVKQALPQLRVQSEWFAPVDRVLREARTIDLTNALLSGFAPRLLDADAERFVIAMTGAPADWTDWKQRLMIGDVQPSVGSMFGHQLARLHRQTRGGEHLDASFFDPSSFEQLRIEPYFRQAATRLPMLSADIRDTVDDLLLRRECLVHGDFSPKNLLVNLRQDAGWIIDFEVAHFGDPAFDIAFLLSHLMLKAIHRPQDAVALDATATAFVDAYERESDGRMQVDVSRVIRVVGCLLAARVAGRSPVEYLDASGREAALATATAIFATCPSTLADLALARG